MGDRPGPRCSARASEGRQQADGIVARWIEVVGQSICFRCSVRSAGGWPPVVLVHGLGLSGRYMLPTARQLAPHFPVYVPDLPGFGDSAKPAKALDVPGLAAALAAWIRAMGLAPAALGNSFGCQVIADLGARHPELVEGAVLQGPTAPPQERSWFWQFVRWRQNQPFNPDSLSPITWDDYRKCGYRRLLQTFRYQLKDAIEQKLPRIPAPVLVVRGQRDPICRLPFVVEMARRLPQGRLVEIPAVAHTLVYTAPEQLAQVTRQFLEEARGPPEPGARPGGDTPHAPRARLRSRPVMG
jgi:2-hydroxy-6-oxonona-2,4-dienedioate hydrolase